MPSDLRDRYLGKTIKHDLKTTYIAHAAKQVEALNRRYEAEWAGLRAAPESSPQALKVHAAALLSEYGLALGDANAPAADQFFDRLENKLYHYAGADQDSYASNRLAASCKPSGATCA